MRDAGGSMTERHLCAYPKEPYMSRVHAPHNEADRTHGHACHKSPPVALDTPGGVMVKVR
jgi:hypothetical protein